MAVMPKVFLPQCLVAVDSVHSGDDTAIESMSARGAAPTDGMISKTMTADALAAHRHKRRSSSYGAGIQSVFPEHGGGFPDDFATHAICIRSGLRGDTTI